MLRKYMGPGGGSFIVHENFSLTYEPANFETKITYEKDFVWLCTEGFKNFGYLIEPNNMDKFFEDMNRHSNEVLFENEIYQRLKTRFDSRLGETKLKTNNDLS